MLSDLDDKMKTEKQSQDCIFDQATQTDEFLKGIKEFEGYVWDTETKTAEIVLNDHWSLTIKRGGCDHFAVNSDFIYDKPLNFEENKKSILDKIIWISNLIEDYDEKIIEEAILNERIDIEIEDNKRHIHFLDERLYEYYYMNFYSDDESSYIHLSYFIN